MLFFYVLLIVTSAASILWSRYGLMGEKKPEELLFMTREQVALCLVTICSVILGIGATFMVNGSQEFVPWMLWPIAVCCLISSDYGQVGIGGIVTLFLGVVLFSRNLVRDELSTALICLGAMLIVAGLIGYSGKCIWRAINYLRAQIQDPTSSSST